MSKLITSMALGTLQESKSGEFLLSGEIDYRNGKQLHDMAKQMLQHSIAQEITLDCSAVTRTSSVGVSLILALLRNAKHFGKKLSIVTLTEDLEEIAKFSGVLDLLPLADSFHVIKNR